VPPHTRLPALLCSVSINELEMADRSEQSPVQVVPPASPARNLRAAESLVPHVAGQMPPTPILNHLVIGINGGRGR